MPNWCENKLIVFADNSNDLEKFKDKMKGNLDRFLWSFHPMPRALEGTRAPQDNPNWYDWCHENWGTKWDVEITIETKDENHVELSFDSAWAPPINWLKKVAKDYPDLNFSLKYNEPGMGFYGKVIARNGIITGEHEYES